MPSRRDRNASTHHCERVMPGGLSARSTTTRRNRDTSWIRKPNRNPVFISLVTVIPRCWFAPSPLALIGGIAKDTVPELSRPLAMARSGLALLELALEHFARDDRLHDLDRTAGDLDDARISIGAARSEEHTSELQSLMRI